MTTRQRALRTALCSASSVVLLLAGCNTLRLLSLNPDRPDRDPLADRPTKKPFRVSQFVFQADFDVQRNLPIFQELANLREQVYKDLQLPPSGTLSKAHLFQNPDPHKPSITPTYPPLPNLQ